MRLMMIKGMINRFTFGALLMALLLFACSGKTGNEKKKPDAAAAEWPIFRGDSKLSGTTAESPPDDLSLLWSFQTGGEIIASPVMGLGRVYVGSVDGKLYAVDLKKGTKVWEFEAGDDIEASALLLDGWLYMGALSGDFFALDAQTGKLNWKFTTENSIYGSANWMSRPGEQEKLILVGSHDNFMYCLGARSGKLQWTYETSHYINGTPAISGSHIVFGGCDEKLHILSLPGGKKAGEVIAGSYIPGSAAVGGEMAYVGHYGSQLLCIDMEDQKIAWRYGDRKKGRPFFSSPALGKDRVVIGSRDGYLHCVDRATGAKKWTFRTRDDVDSSPVIAGDKVIAGSSDGRLYVIDLEDGKLAWSYEIGAPITGCPAVAGGFIVIGALDGRIYTFGEKE